MPHLQIPSHRGLGFNIRIGVVGGAETNIEPVVIVELIMKKPELFKLVLIKIITEIIHHESQWEVLNKADVDQNTLRVQSAG